MGNIFNHLIFLDSCFLAKCIFNDLPLGLKIQQKHFNVLILPHFNFIISQNCWLSVSSASFFAANMTNISKACEFGIQLLSELGSHKFVSENYFLIKKKQKERKKSWREEAAARLYLSAFCLSFPKQRMMNDLFK